MADKRDYYDVLGISKGADDAEIKKAFRAMAKKYHPDAHPGDKECEEKFKEAQEAYAVLSDPEKRRQYDQFGHAAFENGGGGAGGFGGFDFSGADFSDIFGDIFGDFFGTILNVLIVISCIGTLNGLMMASTRAFYTISKRDVNPRFELFKEVDVKTNMPINSSLIGIILVGLWYVYFYGANLTASWFGPFTFDSSELPIITMYGMYFPIFINMIRKERKDLGVFKGIILFSLILSHTILMSPILNIN